MHHNLYSPLTRYLLILFFSIPLFSCSSNDEIEYRELTVYEIYTQASEYLESKRYRDAAIYFDEIERQHPYSVWATKSKLMSAYSLYMNNKYEDSIAALDRFIQVHPGNRDVAYAYYLKALCYYEQISDVERDQDMTERALISLQDIVTRFPESSYARDANLKIDLTRDHLAGKEMAVGRFYIERRHYLAAINRFERVINQYGDTTHSPEALYRLVELYSILGLSEQASKSASVLGFNYPGSEWYNDAYSLIYKEGKKIQKANKNDLLEKKQWWKFW
ncbi:MAG: outer membrane protein assembly factor BamD [Pseudomonadota bacterium]|nr:outer membrane protein assembly factor BamD [Pseudomonadota bacterium]